MIEYCRIGGWEFKTGVAALQVTGWAGGLVGFLF
jgi:hypothetical protein